MRQPEVGRLAALLVAALLAAPALPGLSSLAVAGAFVGEFVSGGRARPLTVLTLEPSREPAAIAGVVADRYARRGLARGAPLVLVHGWAPRGKDDPRLTAAAGLLARAGFEVVVPTIPGLTRGRLRPDDARAVVAALAATAGPAAVVAVSVGAGPALLAAADPAVRDRVRAVLVLGGYASAREVVRYWLTGEYAWDGVRGRRTRDPEAVQRFLAANADLVDASTREILAGGDPSRIGAALAILPRETRALLDALSPERVVREVRAPLILVHGRGDRAVPYTESLRLAAARPRATRLVLVGVVEHVEGAAGRDRAAALRDLLALWAAFYALLAA